MLEKQPLDFKQYQAQFTAHIRNPAQNKKPPKVSASRLAVYKKSVFNNIAAFVSVCFPVCQAVIGQRAWQKLMREFVATYAAGSPLFREIPQQFLLFLEPVQTVPAYFKQLAHYEWVELAIGMQQSEPAAISEVMDLLQEKPVLAAAHMLLQYDYPVHQLSARFKPRQPESTSLLVFRNADFQVKFIELSAVTYRLLKLIQQQDMTGEQALTQLATEIDHPDVAIIIQFGLGVLTDLATQQAIIGSQKR
ncbi:MAG: putative DNA-binding domain-containing protein [Pseudomonadota bacterium]